MPEIEEVFVEDSEDEKRKKAAKKKTGTSEQKSAQAAAKTGSGGKRTNPIEEAASGAIEAFQLDEDELIGASSSPAKSRNKPSLAKGASAFVPDTSY